MSEQNEVSFKDGEGRTQATEVEVKPVTGAKKNTLDEQVSEDQAKIEKAKKKLVANNTQDNVQFQTEDNVILLGNNDLFDQWFAEYFKCERPGFDSLFTDERFPKKDGMPITVSRCYHFPVNGKYVLFDILEEDEYTLEEIKANKAVFNTLGFLYTWVVKGEQDLSLTEIFEERMNLAVPKVKKPFLRQQNVEFITKG